MIKTEITNKPGTSDAIIEEEGEGIKNKDDEDNEEITDTWEIWRKNKNRRAYQSHIKKL